MPSSPLKVFEQNTEDFAIIRVDYENVKPLRTFSLLGISLNEYEKKGTIIFQQNDTKKYALKYMDESAGQRIGIKRPVKIIEKNKNVKGRRKQNEVSCKVHFIVRNIEKIEWLFKLRYGNDYEKYRIKKRKITKRWTQHNSMKIRES